MAQEKTFPRYFIVENDIPVKVENINGEIMGTTSRGRLYPPIKALQEGVETDRDGYDRAAKALSAAS